MKVLKVASWPWRFCCLRDTSPQINNLPSSSSSHLLSLSYIYHSFLSSQSPPSSSLFVLFSLSLVSPSKSLSPPLFFLFDILALILSSPLPQMIHLQPQPIALSFHLKLWASLSNLYKYEWVCCMNWKLLRYLGLPSSDSYSVPARCWSPPTCPCGAMWVTIICWWLTEK